MDRITLRTSASVTPLTSPVIPLLELPRVRLLFNIAIPNYGPDHWPAELNGRSAGSLTRRHGCVGQPPRQNRLARPVHDRHQIEGTAAERDVGDIGRPHLV